MTPRETLHRIIERACKRRVAAIQNFHGAWYARLPATPELWIRVSSLIDAKETDLIIL